MKNRWFNAYLLAIPALAIALVASAPAAAATLTVTKTADTNDGVCDADCSLREAITLAAAGDAVLFSSAANGTILLGSALPTITQSLTLTGNGAANTIIDGNNNGAYRCFNINPAGGGVTISDVTIRNCNVGVANGAAVLATNGTFNLLRSVISGNTGFAALHISAATATITDTTISGNTSTNGLGGIYLLTSSTATITGSTFSGNSGVYSALLVSTGSTATVTNSTFAGNSTPGFANGTVNAGIGATLNLTNSTITGASHYGIYLGGGTAVLSNTIIVGNGFANCSWIGSTLTSNGYNLDSDNTCNLIQATDKSGNANAQLIALANNGGPTQTVALAAGSAAIDAGSCVTNVDQRGNMRPSGATCDIGAFEYAAVPPAVPAITGFSNLNVAQSGSAPSTFTLSGTGALTVAATSSNTALLPNANITGAPACVASGSCTLTLTPAVGQTGTATVTITLSDTYGQQTTANFTVNVATTMQVTYNGNGATGGNAPVDNTAYFAADAVTVSNNGTLTRTGYTFAGWNTQPDGSGTSYTTGATFAINSNTTLFAQWTPQAPASSGGSQPQPQPQTMTYGGGGALSLPWLALLVLLAVRHQRRNESVA